MSVKLSPLSLHNYSGTFQPLDVDVPQSSTFGLQREDREIFFLLIHPHPTSCYLKANGSDLNLYLS